MAPGQEENKNQYLLLCSCIIAYSICGRHIQVLMVRLGLPIGVATVGCWSWRYGAKYATHWFPVTTRNRRAGLVGWLVVGAFTSWQCLKVISGRVLICDSAHSWRLYSVAPTGRPGRQHHDLIPHSVPLLMTTVFSSKEKAEIYVEIYCKFCSNKSILT